MINGYFDDDGNEINPIRCVISLSTLKTISMPLSLLF